MLASALLVRAGSAFFSKRLKQVSDQSLLDSSDRFMALADRYFSTYVKEARQDFDTKEQQLRGALDPVKQVLDRYETQLRQMEKERERSFGAISRHLADMGLTQQRLALETGNLVKALRVPHVRGRWGELTLKRAAELAGMAEHCDFATQVTAGGTRSSKGLVRPDMVVALPGGRKVVVDAKVPLMAYLDALDARDETEQQKRLKDHARQVLNHVRQLSSKQYFEQVTPSPEFTVLFIPGENFFSAALSAEPGLMEQAIEKGVILATPTTLVALLKSVSYAWKQQTLHENTRTIQSLGKTLHERMALLTGHVNRLGKSLGACVETYNRTVGAMENRVMATARKLGDLELSARPMEKPVPLDGEQAAVRKTAGKENKNGGRGENES